MFGHVKMLVKWSPLIFVLLVNFSSICCGSNQLSWYRSRFHPDYFPAVERDLTLLGEIEGSLYSWLCALEVVLPVGGAELNGAHQLQLILLRSIWEGEETKSAISNTPDLAERFSRALLLNMLGAFGELEKPVVGDDPFSSDDTSAWNVFLEEWLDEVRHIYRTVEPDSQLYQYLHERKYIVSISRLLSSPDKRERIAVCWLFLDIMERTLPPRRNDDDEVIKAILGILQKIFSDLNTVISEIGWRPLDVSCALLIRGLEDSKDTKFQAPFRVIFVYAALSLFGSPDYEYCSDYLNEMVVRIFKWAIREKEHSFWGSFTRALVDNCFVNTEFLNETSKLDFIMEIYFAGLLAPKQHHFLMRSLLEYASKAPSTYQHYFITCITNKQFLEALSPESTLYVDEASRRRPLCEFLVGLYDWYLAGSTEPDIQRQLNRWTKWWFNGKSKSILLNDDRYGKAALRLGQKLYGGPTLKPVEDLTAGMGKLTLKRSRRKSLRMSTLTGKNSMDGFKNKTATATLEKPVKTALEKSTKTALKKPKKSALKKPKETALNKPRKTATLEKPKKTITKVAGKRRRRVKSLS